MSRADPAIRVQPLELSSRRATLVVVLLTAAAIGLLYAIDLALRVENFPVRSVRFEGAFERVERAELEAAVMNQVRTNFFLVDLEAIKHRVQALPWVQRASVRRAWPRDVHVQFVEQQLVARWGEQAWLNDAGQVVRVSPTGDHAAVPRLDGPDANSAQVLTQYERLRRPLEQAGLSVRRFEMTPRHSWMLTLADGTVIYVDRQQSLEKLERFARVHGEVFNRVATPPQRIDLRYSNGFAVQWGVRRSSAPPLGRSAESAVGQNANEANKG
jgi:cell division protein FtsQ